MQLGVAAGQVDRVGGRGPAPRRPAARTGCSSAPCRRQPSSTARVGEGEAAVVRHGDALAERRPGPRVGAQDRDAGRARQPLQPVELDPGLDQLGRRRPGTPPRSGCSAACTRPRCRLGRASAASRGMHAQDRAWRHARSRRGSAARACAALATRLRMTPTTSTSSRWRRKPSIRAATEAPMPVTSTTSSTGRPNRAAMSAVAPVPSAAPSNRPMTPSPSRRSQPRPLSSSRPGQRLEAHRPGVDVVGRRGRWRRRGRPGRYSPGRP